MRRGLWYSTFLPCLGAAGILVAGMIPRVARAQHHHLEGSFGYSIAESNETFSRIYDGRFHGSLGYSRQLSSRHRVGVGAEYAQFRGGLVDDVKMHVVAPSALAAHATGLSERLELEGTLRVGYAWIMYRSENVTDLDAFDESGLYVSPGVQIVYSSNDRVSGQIGVGYKVIFEHFGDDNAVEDSTIRYLLVHGGISIGI